MDKAFRSGKYWKYFDHASNLCGRDWPGMKLYSKEGGSFYLDQIAWNPERKSTYARDPYHLLANEIINCSVDEPKNVKKVANAKLTTLRIKEVQHFGSLTCHVLRDTSNKLFDNFFAR